MIKAFWFLIKISLVVAAVIWIAENPGTISIDWGAYTFKMHSGIFLSLLLILMIIGMVVHSIVHTFIKMPKTLRNYNALQAREKGYKALTLGLTAVAAGDTKTAKYQSYRASKFLTEDKGLPVLLEAQAARLDGREDEAQEKFVALLENKDTAFLGMRGLMQAYMAKRQYDKALKIGHEALKLYPKQGWLLKAIYELEIQNQDWDSAVKTLYRAEKIEAIPTMQANSDRIAMLLAQGDNLEKQGRSDEALQKYKKAYKYNDLFAPTITRIGNIYIANNKQRAAIKMVEKAWKIAPHPQLLSIWENAAPQKITTKPGERIKWYKRLVTLNSNSFESHLAVSKAAIEEQLWGEAQTSLEAAEKIRQSVRLYQLWAEKAEKAGESNANIKEYLAKAAQAEADRAWVCTKTGRIFKEWEPTCPPENFFNTIIWDYAYRAQRQDGLLQTISKDNAEENHAVLNAPI